MRTKQIFLLIYIVVHLVAFSFAQDGDRQNKEKILGEVSVTSGKANSNSIYKEIRNTSEDQNSFSGEYARVSNLVLKKDAAIFTFRNGEIYFLNESQGKRTGAVFFGDGEFSINPPIQSEKNSLKFFTKSTQLKEPFSELVLFFTDKTFEDIKNSSGASMSQNGSQAGKARDAFRGKEALYRGRFKYNITTRILMDVMAPPRQGFFTAFINGKNYSNLIYEVDPLGVSGVSPEQVSLTNYNPNDYGSWLAFHMEEEYKKGTGNSNQDRRTFDITHHEIELVIRGERMIATDEVTLKILSAGERVLPFNLFGSMRVKQVLDEDGNEVEFIQQEEKKDSDLAVILPKSPNAGKPFKLTFTYDGAKSLYEAGKGNYILATRTNWYPNNGDSSGFLDRASFDIKFRYPKQFVLVGVGELAESAEDEGDLNYAHWSTKGVEMATAGFNYGDFSKTEIVDKPTGYELSVYNNKYLPGPIQGLINAIENYNSRAIRYDAQQFESNIGSLNTASMAKTVLDEATSSVRLYDHYFGKLPHKRIAMTQQPAMNFGQAWATLIYMPYIAFVSDVHKKELFQVISKLNRGGEGQGLSIAKDKFWREVGPHEVAHQWWGHAVGWKSYRDQWMSEGFSEFSASLFVQHVYKDTDRFIKYWEDQRDLIVNSASDTNGIKPYTVGPVTQGRRLFSTKTSGVYRRLIYPKGAFILHMLRMLMIDPKERGLNKDKRFIAMMHDFIKSHYNQDVSTEDFKRIVEKHMTPQMDLYQNGSMDWFFNQWVYGTDVPAYEFEYSTTKSKGQVMLNAKIIQSDVSDNFVTPVPVYVDYGNGWTELGKAIIVGNKTYELNNIPLPKKPKKAAILALHDVLATKINNKKAD